MLTVLLVPKGGAYPGQTHTHRCCGFSAPAGKHATPVQGAAVTLPKGCAASVCCDHADGRVTTSTDWSSRSPLLSQTIIHKWQVTSLTHQVYLRVQMMPSSSWSGIVLSCTSSAHHSKGAHTATQQSTVSKHTGGWQKMGMLLVCALKGGACSAPLASWPVGSLTVKVLLQALLVAVGHDGTQLGLGGAHAAGVVALPGSSSSSSMGGRHGSGAWCGACWCMPCHEGRRTGALPCDQVHVVCQAGNMDEEIH